MWQFISKSTLYSIIFISLFSACKEEQNTPNDERKNTISGTAEMVSILQEIDKNTKQTVVGYGDNIQYIDKLKKQQKQAQGVSFWKFPSNLHLVIYVQVKQLLALASMKTSILFYGQTIYNFLSSSR